MWKWRDASGRITVSDQPPPRDIPERDILGRPAPRAATPTPAPAPAPAGGAARPEAAQAAAAPSSGAAARVDPDLEARRRAELAKAREASKAGAPQDPQAQARKRDNCQRARTVLATLDSGQRLARLNDKGERVVLDDAMRAQETQRAREVIASECN